VHAYITSVLDQNNSLLIGAPVALIQKLQRIQNVAAKLISRSKKHDHVTEILREFHWLPVHRRIDFKIQLLTYKALNGYGPKYLKDLLHFYMPNRELRSENYDLLQIPRSRLKNYGDRCFRTVAPKLWNSLPLAIRKCDSVMSFKRSLKTYMFKLEYG